METPRIQTRIGIPASADDIWDLIGDLSAWSRWNDYEIDAAGTIAFGGTVSFDEGFPQMEPRRAQMRVMEWAPGQHLILSEKRGLMFRVMRYFEIEQLDRQSCIFANGMVFSGLRGEMYFDKHRRALREATDAIAESMRAAASG
jgi:Polyketide cyclase / dehydrase and lipid transport.